MYSFEVIDIDDVNIEEYYGFENKVLFTTMEWLDFIKINQKAKPVIIRITKNSNFVGYFTGLLFSRFGIRIFGSPFDGWTTGYMGFDVLDGYDKVDLIEPVSKFLFRNFKCLYIQIVDRFIEQNQLKNTKYHYTISKSIELNIDKTDEELLKVFKDTCGRLIRQFERRGAIIEIAEADEEFAIEYYEQLEEVFAKQNLVPTYRVSKVLDLFNSLNNNQLLCLRVRNPEGKGIATSIFVGLNQRFYFWGGASFREFQSYRPNEYMIWYAIKYFREKGYKYFDMYGERDYKNKFCPDKISYPCIMISRLPILFTLKDLAKKLYWFLLKIKGLGKKKKIPNITIFK
ncbi:GNAT family N-acetyltransferase [Clostridium estertheticum]|uniref:GNAT family N-acetyltransferase n=1 Tax=Clostridium estertheticum TaxID=238834 RepID=UPI0013E9631A|nr:GNAT family N-acetyltransferase [Clostridium estertheticum]MBZ9689216.1 GNAT family N-acetyltransferase [Clostridium estertheticum]